MTGFYKVDPREVFTPDGWYATNDRASFDADGFMYFHGRQGDMLKMAGANVSRMEGFRARSAGLPESTCRSSSACPMRRWASSSLRGCAREGTYPTEEGLKAALREKLSSYKIPRRIVVISAEDVQWTPSNKIKLVEMGE